VCAVEKGVYGTGCEVLGRVGEALCAVEPGVGCVGGVGEAVCDKG
jgi:hypothetical protein